LGEKLVQIGARIVRHGRYAGCSSWPRSRLPRALFADILRRIDDLRPPPLSA
jgi:hypothetical protein